LLHKLPGLKQNWYQIAGNPFTDHRGIDGDVT